MRTGQAFMMFSEGMEEHFPNLIQEQRPHNPEQPDMLQGLVNRNRILPEGKQCVTDPGGDWATGTFVLWGMVQGSPLEWQQ